MENKQRELIDLIVRTHNITKTEIAKELGFKAVTSFYTSIKRRGLTMKKIEHLLEKYEIDMNFKERK